MKKLLISFNLNEVALFNVKAGDSSSEDYSQCGTRTERNLIEIKHPGPTFLYRVYKIDECTGERISSRIEAVFGPYL